MCSNCVSYKGFTSFVCAYAVRVDIETRSKSLKEYDLILDKRSTAISFDVYTSLPNFSFLNLKNTIVDIIYNELVCFLQFATSAILLETVLTLLSEQ